MILSGSSIKEYIFAGLISVSPAFDEKQLRPFGLRVHLGNEVLWPIAGARVDLSETGERRKLFTSRDIQDGPLCLRPGDFVLGSTIERVRIQPDMFCLLDGRSTIARLGISIHCSSHIVDGNNIEHGSIVLGIKNNGPFQVVMPFGCAIGMLLFEVGHAQHTPDLSNPPSVEQDREAFKNESGSYDDFTDALHRR